MSRGAGPDGMTDSVITEAVGEELRRVRDRLGWTRNTVVEDMDLTIQGLANYEYGTRPCTVARFVQICERLEVAADDVLGLALQRAEAELHRGGVHVDLHAVVRDRRPELRPLRRWARHRLADDPDGPGVARVDRAVLKDMAAFLGYSRTEFTRHLLSFTPESAPKR